MNHATGVMTLDKNLETSGNHKTSTPHKTARHCERSAAISTFEVYWQWGVREVGSMLPLPRLRPTS